MIDTRGFGEARSAAFDMGGNLVAEVAVGTPIRVVDAQLRADPPADQRPDLVDMEVIVRRQDRVHCASITSMIRHYVARRAEVIEDHPHNAEMSVSSARIAMHRPTYSLTVGSIPSSPYR
jgi:hypothetical protein